MSPKEEDRGVESTNEEVSLDGEDIVREITHEEDGIGEPAAPEDDKGGG